MIQVISFELRRMAEFVIFAEDLTLEKLNHVVESIEDIAKDKSNFDPNAEYPLTFNKKGLNAIKRIDPAIAAPTILAVLKRLDAAVKASLDEDLQNLNQYLQKSLRRTPGKWINLVLNGKDFEENKSLIIDQAIKPFIFAMNNLTLTPRKRQWEKEELESAPAKGLKPEKFKEYYPQMIK